MQIFKMEVKFQQILGLVDNKLSWAQVAGPENMIIYYLNNEYSVKN